MENIGGKLLRGRGMWLGRGRLTADHEIDKGDRRDLLNILSSFSYHRDFSEVQGHSYVLVLAIF